MPKSVQANAMWFVVAMAFCFVVSLFVQLWFGVLGTPVALQHAAITLSWPYRSCPTAAEGPPFWHGSLFRPWYIHALSTKILNVTQGTPKGLRIDY